jgi:uncharacterized protein
MAKKAKKTGTARTLYDQDPTSCYVGDSKIAGKGLFAGRNISPGERIAEYEGERIRSEEAGRRADAGNDYIMELGPVWHIDGLVNRGVMSFANYSCTPNCSFEKEEGRVFLHSEVQIAQGEEITAAYNWSFEETLGRSCSCGSDDCRHFMASFEEIARNVLSPPFLFVAPSKIHGRGLFTDIQIPEGERIIEYIGEKISTLEGWGRVYQGCRSAVELNRNSCLDASIRGNFVRWLNHSCNPNANVYSYQHEGKIFVMAERDIGKGDEITMDGGYPLVNPVAHLILNEPCNCGVNSCRGYMVTEEDADRARKLMDGRSFEDLTIKEDAKEWMESKGL